DCGPTFGFVVNRYSDNLVRMDFPQGVAGPISYTMLGNIGGLYHPHGISDVYRADNELFVFIANVDNHTLSRIYYTTCTEPSILTSTLRDPPQLYYRHEGNYNISLILDMGQPTEELYCKNIVVLPKPNVSLGNDTSVCPYLPFKLDAGTGFTSYLWNTGSKQQTLTTDSAGTFWVEVKNDKGCTDRDTLTVTRFPDNLSLGNDRPYTLGEPIILDAGNGYRTYSWSTGMSSQRITVIKPGDYSVSVTDFNNCTFRDTIRLTLEIVLPNFFTPNGDGINDRWEPKLFVHYPEAEIKIFDRYGKLMASYRGDEQGWDGTYNGRLAEPDTYWYVVDLKNGIKPITGQITIKR
ncbi:MAG TPA: T9SS type B sorting domain-containing protein, partial [Bacteroidales bacterium]